MKNVLYHGNKHCHTYVKGSLLLFTCGGACVVQLVWNRTSNTYIPKITIKLSRESEKVLHVMWQICVWSLAKRKWVYTMIYFFLKWNFSSTHPPSWKCFLWKENSHQEISWFLLRINITFFPIKIYRWVDEGHRSFNLIKYRKSNHTATSSPIHKLP